MKATVTISIEVSDLGDLEYVERVLEAGLGTAAKPTIVKVDPTPPDVPEPVAEEPPAKKTRKKRTSKKAAKKPEPEPEPAPEPTPEPEASTSIDDVKEAVRACVEVFGIDHARKAFTQFGAEKLSDVSETDYPKLVVALRGDL